MFIMGQRDGKDIVYSGAGDELKISLAKVSIYCEEKDCSVIFSFNGIEHEINKTSYLDGLYNNWFNPSYDSIKDTRDNRIEKILKK